MNTENTNCTRCGKPAPELISLGSDHFCSDCYLAEYSDENIHLKEQQIITADYLEDLSY